LRARNRILLVTPAPDGNGWVVVDGDRQLRHFIRKRDATLAGRELLQTWGGGDLLIRNLSGRVTEKDSVPAG
jgi:hypothetical protein